jgi:glutaminyl-peptide cyclotransferase
MTSGQRTSSSRASSEACTEPLDFARDELRRRVARLRKAARLANLGYFDLEDQGGLDGHRWAEGATLEAAFLGHSDLALVIVMDMVGDADQKLFIERRSHRNTAQRLWSVAGELGYGQWFVPEIRHRVLDDHVPFARHGVPLYW